MPLMNSFYKRHRDSIQWHYRCFDRILLNGLIQPFQQPERVVGFFNTYRQLYPVSRHTLRDRSQRSWNRMSVVYCTMPGLVSKGLGCDGWTLRLRDRPIRGSTSRVISPTALAYFTTWCPAGTSIKTPVSVEGHRWTIEDSFETAKNEFGLDHDKSRSWHGWHRHVSLVMLGFAMMAATYRLTPPRNLRSISKGRSHGLGAMGNAEAARPQAQVVAQGSEPRCF